MSLKRRRRGRVISVPRHLRQAVLGFSSASASTDYLRCATHEQFSTIIEPVILASDLPRGSVVVSERMV